jgi:adenylate cyclase
MEQEIYKSYTDNVRNLLATGKKRGSFEKGFSYNDLNSIGNNRSNIQLVNENKDISLFNSLNALSTVSGKKAKYHERPGQHPDFSHLKNTDLTEHHYITSMFIDIKNSTGLFKNYEPLAVANITTAIQKAAMHTCWYFDGFIQRFHGDGLLVYFGSKTTTLKQSVSNAINSASFFSYFMKNDLKEVFLEQGVERLFTRIGIDTGEDADVVWHMAGMQDCSEVTTCSLHTSLAAKMQNHADSNGIMLGDNVKDNSLLAIDFFSIKYNEKDMKEERYIFQMPEENFNYTQWIFNWDKYLKNHPAVVEDANGKLYFKPKPNATLGNNANTSSLNREFLTANVEGYKPYFKN